ncbi:hypothetical protein [Candidatus Pelagibacter sp. IMCC9063]|uniref:hypothetical protein n=1 Tax=Pelagibacter sp. (strain IMCC9063) TaxID=1002672 RepID=UPI0013051426|nr:hypothetical protein [Candidatus Pelagibacter sp. IMCC9063]
MVIVKTNYFPIIWLLMKKIVITLFLVLFTSSAYAGSCPMMAKSIDDKIAEENLLRFTI